MTPFAITTKPSASILTFSLSGRARKSLRYAKRFQESLADYDAVIALSPNDAEVVRGHGIALARLGRHEEAKAALDRAVALEPSVDNRLARAAYFVTLKNHDAAFEDYSAILSDSPDDRGGRMGRAQIYVLREQLDLALADYEAVLRAHGPYREAFQGRGYVFERRGRLDLARADYERALRLDPDNAWLKSALARLPK